MSNKRTDRELAIELCFQVMGRHDWGYKLFGKLDKIEEFVKEGRDKGYSDATIAEYFYAPLILEGII